MGIDPGGPAGQAPERLASGFQDAPPLEPRAAAVDVWLETAHDYVIRAQYRDSRGEKYESRDDGQKTADHAQDQQADAENCANNVAHASYYVKDDRSVQVRAVK